MIVKMHLANEKKSRTEENWSLIEKERKEARCSEWGEGKGTQVVQIKQLELLNNVTNRTLTFVCVYVCFFFTSMFFLSFFQFSYWTVHITKSNCDFDSKSIIILDFNETVRSNSNESREKYYCYFSRMTETCTVQFVWVFNRVFVRAYKMHNWFLSLLLFF